MLMLIEASLCNGRHQSRLYSGFRRRKTEPRLMAAFVVAETCNFEQWTASKTTIWTEGGRERHVELAPPIFRPPGWSTLIQIASPILFPNFQDEPYGNIIRPVASNFYSRLNLPPPSRDESGVAHSHKVTKYTTVCGVTLPLVGDGSEKGSSRQASPTKFQPTLGTVQYLFLGASHSPVRATVRWVSAYQLRLDVSLEDQDASAGQPAPRNMDGGLHRYPFKHLVLHASLGIKG
ncbi:hypothetical protein B0T24DRAFT_615530 [Lasiosphaeria ovina]|uniref:Uncharacterized protein n=1 Tax=Lasiosphaeria ovina TaxID=92902 RepID=A0AAE0NFC9_9PEZI|nr:hypothetical protein B0T24DRAFT_615530 [Lasiosphaeria ovina]